MACICATVAVPALMWFYGTIEGALNMVLDLLPKWHLTRVRRVIAEAIRKVNHGTQA